MSDPAKIEVFIPEGSPRCIVRPETIAGSGIPGVAFRLMDPGESETFSIEAGQRLVIEQHPVKE